MTVAWAVDEVRWAQGAVHVNDAIERVKRDAIPGPWRTSPSTVHATFVPYRFSRLVDPAVFAEDQVPVEAAGEPAVVSDGENRALERLQTRLEGLGRLDVEIVGRLVEQQQRGAGELQQQDLEARLLAARQRLEPLLRGVGARTAACEYACLVRSGLEPASWPSS
jgi:hypothetical protein